MNTKKCPICDSDITREFIIDLRICGNCNHIFKKDIVPATQYVDYVSSAQAIRSTKHLNDALQTSLRRLNFIKHFKTGGSLLEVGCGYEFFLEQASKSGFSVTGLELSERLVEMIGKRYKMLFGSPVSLEGSEEHYDVIAAFHVLEHFNDPIAELRELVAHLKDNGMIFLEYPNLNFYGLELHPAEFYEGNHTQYFNQISMMTLFERCGLKPLMQVNHWDGKIGVSLICLIKENVNIDALQERVYRAIGGI